MGRPLPPHRSLLPSSSRRRPSATDPKNGLTIGNATASTYGLIVALVWFAIGLGVIIFYTAFVYRLFRRPTVDQAGQ
jgi:cytochrome bd-type quinol oxidase subunit 2